MAHNGIILGPDWIYLTCLGKSTFCQKRFIQSKTHLGRKINSSMPLKDPKKGHANDVVATGGWVAETDRTVKN